VRHLTLRALILRSLAALAALAAAAFFCWAAYQVAAGRTSPPVFTRESAHKALTALRAANGARWAPNATRAAESAVRAGLAEYLRQEARTFFFMRNFDDARGRLNRAEESCRQAMRVAQEERTRARAAADRSLEQAQQTVGAAVNIARAIHLSSYEHMLLRKSQLAIAEAEILYEHEEFAAVAQRAELAALQADRVSDRAARAAARFTDPTTVRQWRRMAEETVDWSRRTRSPAIVVFKESHRLTLFDDGRPRKSYKIDLGSNSIRDKQRAGDNATPEGRYWVTKKKGLGDSRYHRALLLNYPNDEDRAQFNRLRKAGELPRWATPGGLIEIHGDGGRGKDWTNGCVALDNRDMDDLFARVGVGTPVTIVGGDGSGGTFTDIVRFRGNGNGGAQAD